MQLNKTPAVWTITGQPDFYWKIDVFFFAFNIYTTDCQSDIFVQTLLVSYFFLRPRFILIDESDNGKSSAISESFEK